MKKLCKKDFKKIRRSTAHKQKDSFIHESRFRLPNKIFQIQVENGKIFKLGKIKDACEFFMSGKTHTHMPEKCPGLKVGIFRMQNNFRPGIF